MPHQSRSQFDVEEIGNATERNVNRQERDAQRPSQDGSLRCHDHRHVRNSAAFSQELCVTRKFIARRTQRSLGNGCRYESVHVAGQRHGDALFDGRCRQGSGLLLPPAVPSPDRDVRRAAGASRGRVALLDART